MWSYCKFYELKGRWDIPIDNRHYWDKYSVFFLTSLIEIIRNNLKLQQNQWKIVQGLQPWYRVKKGFE